MSAAEATVRIVNGNTAKLIHAILAAGDREATAAGEFAIDGVAVTASPVGLDFIGPAGARLGKLLPTGNAVDTFDGVEIACIDVANPFIFLNAWSVNINGTALPDDLQADSKLLARLESIRTQAAIAMDLVKTAEDTPASIGIHPHSLHGLTAKHSSPNLMETTPQPLNRLGRSRHIRRTATSRRPFHHIHGVGGCSKDAWLENRVLHCSAEGGRRSDHDITPER